MINRTIKVKVIKELSTKVHIRVLSSNSKMIINKAEFEERVEKGVYEVKE